MCSCCNAVPSKPFGQRHIGPDWSLLHTPPWRQVKMSHGGGYSQRVPWAGVGQLQRNSFCKFSQVPNSTKYQYIKHYELKCKHQSTPSPILGIGRQQDFAKHFGPEPVYPAVPNCIPFLRRLRSISRIVVFRGRPLFLLLEWYLSSYSGRTGGRTGGNAFGASK